MSGRLFLFIDESGDAGYEKPDSSKYYAELVLSVTDDCLPDLNRPILNWRYCRNLVQEIKRPPKKGDLTKLFLQPFSELHRMDMIKCACVYLIKEDYKGPYLKDTSYRGKKPNWFRNWVHRQLLEYYFSLHKPTAEYIEIVFDRFEISDKDKAELELYLARNWSLPKFRHITQADSIYVETLQVVSQLANLVQEVILGEATFDYRLLDFVSKKDITRI